MHPLLAGPVRVINIGLPAFARDLAAAGSPVVQVETRSMPPCRKEFFE